jgi:hypothetical protein
VKVYGIDMTSRPSRRKPLTCAHCELEPGRLIVKEVRCLLDFETLEEQLAGPGPWITGMDFPFGQSRRFLEGAGWPLRWPDYVERVRRLDRDQLVKELEDYKRHREPGDREHRRRTDCLAGSISPQKLYGVPVAKMFFEGAKRILGSGAHIPPVHAGDRSRIIVEAYPGILARSLCATGYKSDTRRKQTEKHHENRLAILRGIHGQGFAELYGFTVEAPASLATDRSGDALDAVLCAAQAAWAWTKRDQGFGIPGDADSAEGWIVDPHVARRAAEAGQ